MPNYNFAVNTEALTYSMNKHKSFRYGTKSNNTHDVSYGEDIEVK